MSPNPVANDARRARRTRRLPPDARCLTCSTDNPVVLRAAGTEHPVNRLEEHHIAGWRIDTALTTVQCQNCHAINHEDMLDAGVNLRRPSTNTLDQLHDYLIAVGAFLHRLADSMAAFAVRLRALITALDHDYPAWRTLLETS